MYVFSLFVVHEFFHGYLKSDIDCIGWTLISSKLKILQNPWKLEPTNINKKIQCMNTSSIHNLASRFVSFSDVVSSQANTSFQQHKTGFYTCPVWDKKQIPEAGLFLPFRIPIYYTNSFLSHFVWQEIDMHTLT